MKFTIWKALTLLVTATLLTGCGTNDGVPEKDGLTIVTTNFFLYDTARTLARDNDTVVMLISPGAESHDYELTLTDMATLENCDLFAYIGGEGEDWVYDALDTFADSGITIPTFCAMEAVEENGTLVHSAEEHDHLHDHGHEEHTEEHWEGYDDHVWLSIPNAIAIYEGMTDTLTSYYEDWQPGVMEDGAQGWKYTLTEWDEKYRALVADAADPFLVVADRFPYTYLTTEYSIDSIAAFSGCTSDTEPTLDVVDRLITEVEKRQNKTILVTELSDRQTASAIAKQVDGVTIEELHSCHNVTKEDFEGGVTYVDLLERNYAVLEKVIK